MDTEGFTLCIILKVGVATFPNSDRTRHFDEADIISVKEPYICCGAMLLVRWFAMLFTDACCGDIMAWFCCGEVIKLDSMLNSLSSCSRSFSLSLSAASLSSRLRLTSLSSNLSSASLWYRRNESIVFSKEASSFSARFCFFAAVFTCCRFLFEK